jgi:hypothetical protein
MAEQLACRSASKYRRSNFGPGRMNVGWPSRKANKYRPLAAFGRFGKALVQGAADAAGKIFAGIIAGCFEEHSQWINSAWPNLA